MRESVIYQDILQEGIEKGWEKGRQEGRQVGQQEGRQKEGLSLMLNLLTSRWGAPPPNLLEKLNSLSIEQIEELSRTVFNLNNLSELSKWLHNHTKPL